MEKIFFIGLAGVSVLGGAVGRCLWEGREISLNPSFKYGALSAVSLPLASLCAYKTSEYLNPSGYSKNTKTSTTTRSPETRTAENISVCVFGLVMFLANFYPREHWKIKVISNLAGFATILVVSICVSPFLPSRGEKPK